MNSRTTEAIGEEVGAFLEANTDDVNTMVRRFLCIKVRIDTRKPLMRGMVMIIESSGIERCCPLAHEYLPNFCYIYGLLGHIDKLCGVCWEKGSCYRTIEAYDVFQQKKKGVLKLGGRGEFRSMLLWRTNPGGSGSRCSLSGS
jgi:hypothetical protein